MFTHAPADYVCPICLAINGIESPQTQVTQSDIFYRDEFVMGFIRTKFVTGNEGSVLLVPTKHFENLYELPPEFGHRIFDVAVRVARAMKEARRCDGVTLIQNNEPAGDQHAFHFHLHLFPRFTGDHFHEERAHERISSAQERAPFAEALRGRS